jgi:hypothetical protein
MLIAAPIVFVFRVLNVADVHSWNLILKGSSQSPVPCSEKSNFVPTGQNSEQGLVAVLQRVVAEAELAPRNADMAIAATAARPNIFRYFISFLLVKRRSAGEIDDKS